MTATRFQKPSTFSLKAYTTGAFGMFGSGKLQKITVSFTGWAATNVRELQWHPSQKIARDSSDGSGGLVVATFELSDTREFKRWLLGYGRYATVVSPDSLRADVRTELQANLATYGT
jgi:predicted DNA-binding transcriptional regulator YafY